MPRGLSFPKTLWWIVAVGFALRLLGAWRANLIFDELAHLALAETISFEPGRLHLVPRTLDHPLLSIYILKIGSLIFGSSDFGLRLPYVLAGTLTLIPVYCLGRRVFGESGGLWAAGLLAVDQFHASWSRVFMPEVLMLLFVALTLLQFLRTEEAGTPRNFVYLGALMGLAYLAKEPAVLCIAALWVYVLVTPAGWRWLFNPRWYLAHVVLLLVVSVDLVWNLSQWSESYLYRGVAFASEPWQLSFKSFSLYIGELFRVFIGRDVLDTDYLAGRVYVAHWVAGVLYLSAVAAMVSKWNQLSARLLLVTFFVVFGVFLVMPGGARFEPFWWPSISLIPAVVLAGGLVEKLVRISDVRFPSKDRPFNPQLGSVWPPTASAATALLFLGYLTVQYIPVAWYAGPFSPRLTVADLVRSFSGFGANALKAGQLDVATQRYIYVLNIGGPNCNAYNNLADIADLQGNPRKAQSLRAKCRALEQPPE